MTQEELLKWLEEENGYFNLRVIDGRIIGNLRMLFTVDLVIDIDESGNKKRFICMKTRL